MVKTLASKVDNLMSFQTQKIDEILEKIEAKAPGAELTTVTQNLHSLTKKVDDLKDNNVNTGQTTPWQNDCQDIMLDMAAKIEAIEKTVNKGTAVDEIMVITDSNGKFLKPELLHHEKKVKMESIYTLDEASDPKNLPKHDNPALVKDIVFNTGLNDSRDNRTPIETIVKRQKTACHHFHHRFKNARFHIVATAPVTLRQKNLNRQLEEYATSAGILYVSNDAIMDEATGGFKDGMMNGIHYTPLGTSKVAQQLKRNIYAKEPIQSAPQPRDRQSLLRPTYLSYQNWQPGWQNRQQQSNVRPVANQNSADNLIDQMSALLQKWQNGPIPRQ